jgi:hypothetical protein
MRGTLFAATTKWVFYMGSVETMQQHLPSLDSPLTGGVSNDRNTTLHSFFALESKRTDPIEYKASGVEIVVQGTKSGIATINDKGILVYICSIASQKLGRGEHVSQKFRFTAHDFFNVTGKTPGGKTYRYFAAALERLQGTQIKTNLVTGGRRERTWLSRAHTVASGSARCGSISWRERPALLPDMPVVNQRELPIGDATNRVGHAIEAEIDAVGQDRREQGWLVYCG